MAYSEQDDVVEVVSFNRLQDLKNGWCPYCNPVLSNIKQTGHYTFKCINCGTKFIYKGDH